MSPRADSRYLLCSAAKDESDRLLLSERSPYGYKNFSDNRTHTAKEGDTLFHLAAAYFFPLERAAGFFWVIGDFQPDPIIDPTLKLEIGRKLYIPSIRTLRTVILSEDRREEFTP